MLRLHPLHPCLGPMPCEGFDSIRPSQPKRCSDRSSEEGTARRAEGVLRLDRSTVWAETAVSSRFLHMALTRGIGAADTALTWIGEAEIFRAVTADRCYVSMPTAPRSTSSIRPIGLHRSKYLHLAYPCQGFIRRIYASGQCHVKESTRYGRLSPHSAPIEVGAHPRRPVGRPLEASNGTLGAPERPPRALSFTGQPAAAELRPRMAT